MGPGLTPPRLHHAPELIPLLEAPGHRLGRATGVRRGLFLEAEQVMDLPEGTRQCQSRTRGRTTQNELADHGERLSQWLEVARGGTGVVGVGGGRRAVALQEGEGHGQQPIA